MRKAVILLVVVVFITALAAQTTRPKPVIKVTHLGVMDVGIVCQNGADPTGQKFGGVLIVSCGKE